MIPIESLDTKELTDQLGMSSIFDDIPDEDAVLELWSDRLDNGLCPACGRVTIQLTSATDPILKRLRLPDGVCVHTCAVGHYAVVNRENGFIVFTKPDSRARMLGYLIELERKDGHVGG